MLASDREHVTKRSASVPLCGFRYEANRYTGRSSNYLNCALAAASPSAYHCATRNYFSLIACEWRGIDEEDESTLRLHLANSKSTAAHSVQSVYISVFQLWKS